MNATYYRLSSELDQLTKWGRKMEGEDSNRFFYVKDGGDISIANRYDEWVRNGKNPIICPAYELEYLMKKLQRMSKEYNVKLYYSIIYREWYCMYQGFGSKKAGDTAEEAAIRLAIYIVKEQRLGIR